MVDLSAPHQRDDHPSLTELIDKEEFSLTYVTIDTAIRIIKKLGRGSWMCKVDIQDAFKLIPIKESLWPYYGVKWVWEVVLVRRFLIHCPKLFVGYYKTIMIFNM